MMYLWIALATFFVVTTAQTVVELHEVWWTLAMVVLPLVGLLVVGDLRHWYGSLAISGLALLFLRADNLLMIKADETLVNLRRLQRR